MALINLNYCLNCPDCLKLASGFADMGLSKVPSTNFNKPPLKPFSTNINKLQQTSLDKAPIYRDETVHGIGWCSLLNYTFCE